MANLGFGGSPMGMSNPYLQDQSQAITNTANQNFNNQVQPALNSGAQMAGQYGSSRDGIAQGVAQGMNQQGISNSLANMYSTAYGQDQNYNLGMTNLQNNAAVQGANIAQQNAMLPYQQLSSLFSTGSQLNNTDWSNLQNLSGAIMPGAGLGSTSSTTGSKAASIWSFLGM